VGIEEQGMIVSHHSDVRVPRIDFHLLRGTIMKSAQLFRATLRAAAATTILAASVAAQGNACAGNTHCDEVSSFVATVTDFRTSVSGRYRLVATTIRFQNKLNRPLILGYVPRSGIATDDRGNRYESNDGGVRGIGLISNGALDVKFVLQPGESSDARFEFGWQPGREIYGSAFQVELAIREIDPVASHQYTLGKEHALRFTGFGTGSAVVAAPVTPAPVTPAPATVAAAVIPVADPCGGAPRCYSAGPFIAEVSRFDGSRVGNRQDHALRITLKFRNVTAQPIILAYHTGSSTVTDNLGNRYFWGRAGTHDMSSSGIGIVEGTKADPQFVLQPGQSREANFNLIRYNSGRAELGTTFTYDVVIDQLELLNGGQIRSVRSYSLGYHDLPLSGSGITAKGAQPNPLIEALKKKLAQKPR
jgi:hypothetical protein